MAAEDLLEKGLPVDHKDNQGRTALDSAVQNDCLPIATALLDNPFTNVNEEDNSGQTALFIAVEGSGDQSLLSMLLDKGADVNHQDQSGKTPLMVAALSGRDCNVLLQHGANVATVDHAGNTALWYAASVGSATAASSLLQGGSSVVNQPGEKGKTPFAIACWNTHPEVARILLAHGADPNIKDDYGQNPLNLATPIYHAPEPFTDAGGYTPIHQHRGPVDSKTTKSAGCLAGFGGSQGELEHLRFRRLHPVAQFAEVPEKPMGCTCTGRGL